LQRHLAQAADLELAGHPHRARHHGEVVGGDRTGAAVDVAPAGDDAVGGRLDAVHRALGKVWTGVNADLDEGPRVAEQVEPLARGQLAALVLLGDLLLAAAELGLFAARVEVLGQGLHPGLLAALDLVGRFRGISRRLLRIASGGGGSGASGLATLVVLSVICPSIGFAFFKERLDTLEDVFGGEGQRELRAQELERVVERHVLLAVHRVVAEAHQHRALRGQLRRPLVDGVLELALGTALLASPNSTACSAEICSPRSIISLTFLRGTLR